LDEVLEVMCGREACATSMTSNQIGVVLEEGLDGGFFTAGFKG
jgi:hypothetical protein